MNERERTVWKALRDYILSDGRAQWHLVSGLDDLLDDVTESTTDEVDCGGYYTGDEIRYAFNRIDGDFGPASAATLLRKIRDMRKKA